MHAVERGQALFESLVILAALALCAGIIAWLFLKEGKGGTASPAKRGAPISAYAVAGAGGAGAASLLAARLEC